MQTIENLPQTEKRLYKIDSEDVFLVPYLKEMVATYHGWMQDPDLLALTASEPLSLEEEYENQESWIKDMKKYTFIIFRKVEDKEHLEQGLPRLCQGGKMLGDVNLFIHNYLEDNEAEIDIMVADFAARKKGIATKAVKLMMNFCIKELKRNVFIAKILQSNTPSIKLFEKLGFKKIKELPAFEEVHYMFEVDKSVIEQGGDAFTDIQYTMTQLQ